MAENFPRVGRFSCVVVSTMSFSSKLAGHRGLESASLMRPPRPWPRQRSANLPRWRPEKVPGPLALGCVSCPRHPLPISSHPEMS